MMVRFTANPGSAGCQQLTELISREKIILRFPRIEGGRPQKGIQWKRPVITAPERATLAPASKSFCAAGGGPVSARCHRAVVPARVGDLGDINVVGPMNDVDPLVVV